MAVGPWLMKPYTTPPSILNSHDLDTAHASLAVGQIRM